MKKIKKLFKNAWNWHLKYYASTYKSMFGTFTHNV